MAENINLGLITDCADQNARARQELAYKQLFGGMQPTFVGVDTTSDAPALEAAGHLVDMLGVLHEFQGPASRSGIVAQVAPRGSDIKMDHDNGTPFCFFKCEGTWVATTLNGCLSLAYEQGLVEKVEVVDIPTVVAAMTQCGALTAEEAAAITNTQFRSLNFLPRLLCWLMDGQTIPSTTLALADILPPAKPVVWFVDNFGNGKTNILPETIDFENGKRVELAQGKTATCHTRLADVKTGEIALVIGSSGYKERRWLEVVVGRGRANETLGFTVGSAVFNDAK